MIYRTSLIAMSCILLSSCAYFQDQSYQTLKIETPGAANAVCHVTINKLKYLFYPPEAQTVIKSGDPMKVACKAPGNRDKTIMVEAAVEGSTSNNVFGPGLIGLGWDNASDAMYTYPDTVYVDFNDVPVMDMPMPQHNNPDINQPEEHTLEEFLPTNPMMNKDKNRKTQTWQRKGDFGDVDANPTLGKGDLQPVSRDPERSGQTGSGYYAGQ